MRSSFSATQLSCQRSKSNESAFHLVGVELGIPGQDPGGSVVKYFGLYPEYYGKSVKGFH